MAHTVRNIVVVGYFIGLCYIIAGIIGYITQRKREFAGGGSGNFRVNAVTSD